MMSITHAAIAITTTSISLGTANGFVLACSLIGSQLPDCDTTESMAGKVIFPIARFLEERFPHRTITHSFASSLALAIVSSPLIYFGYWQQWAALNIGHFCGWFSDSFTKSGVAAFWPSPARFVIPGNPRARLRSQSPAEYWVLGITVFWRSPPSICPALAALLSSSPDRSFQT
ncbi:MAG: metal-dependent hydrolase [Leptolyngbyaceae cyanobacterium SM1_3_5]|nr:metal-dependent hydrolase [Leptolyngbyaceae cyanobacterium SM1_3_5]